MSISCETLAEQIGSLFACAPFQHMIRIRTPFLYPDGDVMDVFLQETNGIINLTDAGETLRWLRAQTAALRRSKKQNALIDDICMTHGVENFRGNLMLRIEAGDDAGAAVTRLAQAMLRVADLWVALRYQVFESIADEVEELLRDEQIPYERGAKLIGRSMKSWTVDFHTRHPNRSAFVAVLSAANSAVAQTQTNNALARWIDLSHRQLSGIRFISLFDDSSEVWQEYHFKQLEEISETLFWSRPDALKTRLIA